MDYIDLRSDTVTVPTPEMRTAMANAVVGDDVYGEDPTVKALQEYAASLLKKDGALFVPSGTFGNQCSILTTTNRSQELVASNLAHILNAECGAVGLISGVVVRAIDVSDSNGLLTAEKVENAIRTDQSIVSSETGLIAIEQPTLQGKVYPLQTLKEIYEVAKKNNIYVHMDGARLFNAATYLKCQPWEIAQYCDTLMFCLSKGLCAPVGSLIVGSSIFIQRATKMRKLLGGGLRQVGVLAAPGLLAVQEQTKYLEKDHQMAALLAEKLSTIPQIKVVDTSIQINMIHVQFDQTVDFNDLKQHMLAKQIKLGGLSKGICRIMTHFYVRESQVEAVYEAFKHYMETKVNKTH